MVILPIVIAILQSLFLVGKRVEFTAPFLKKHGRIIMLIGSAVVTMAAAVIAGSTPGDAIVTFFASSGTTLVNDLLHQTNLIEHKRNDVGEAIDKNV